MRRVMASLTISACLLLPSAGVVLGADPHSPSNPTGPATGRPSQTCGVTTGPALPGNTLNSPGSAFNPGGVAPSVYAGAMGTPSAAHAASPNGVAAQYDVACFQIP
jgi:hypothetical protein